MKVTPRDILKFSEPDFPRIVLKKTIANYTGCVVFLLLHSCSWREILEDPTLQKYVPRTNKAFSVSWHGKDDCVGQVVFDLSSCSLTVTGSLQIHTLRHHSVSSSEGTSRRWQEWAHNIIWQNLWNRPILSFLDTALSWHLVFRTFGPSEMLHFGSKSEPCIICIWILQLSCIEIHLVWGLCFSYCFLSIVKHLFLNKSKLDFLNQSRNRKLDICKEWFGWKTNVSDPSIIISTLRKFRRCSIIVTCLDNQA